MISLTDDNTEAALPPDEIRLVIADSFAPVSDDGDEMWWMTHYACSCGWVSHDPHTSVPDDGVAAAMEHAAETGHLIVGGADE